MLQKKIPYLFFIFIFFSPSLFAQAVHSDSTRLDSVVKKAVPRSGIKAFDDVISNNYIARIGLFTVYQLRDTIYFEIPDSILHRDIEVINRLEQGPGGTGAYAGEELDEKTIQFERNNEDSSIRIRYDMVISSADPNSEIYKAVSNSNLNPVVISFPIKAYGREEKSCIIDVSRWIKDSRSFVNSVDPRTSLAQRVNIYAQRDLNVELIHAYPINVEFSISKNSESRPTKESPSAEPVTMITHCSFVELPQVPMQQRVADERVGYFADQVWHFGDRQQKVEDRRFILRWRLEPRDEDKERYARGELVEPKKPIVIYIDPATPRQWRPYLIQGINDWQKTFEQAGFKNAIIGKEWPENDWTMHADDARYSFINYLPSEIENAYGPQVHDPRSGEIIQTHIGWYHNVMQLLHDWYMVQAGATDPRARYAKFDDELMGQLIRFVSSHEVGHTLGLRHNMGASSTVPVDSLRSRHFLELHGHTPSIMDYSRFNYVAQPEDSIPEQDMFPKIGEYDRWAIQWGYRVSESDEFDKDKLVARKLVTDSLSKNPRLWFGADNRETGRKDPRCQTEDLGNDAMTASYWGIKNLKRILPNLPQWTKEDEGGYEGLTDMYRAVKNQYFRYIQHVMMYIGGVYNTPKSQSDQGSVVEPAPIAMQKEALEFFDRELFSTPYWILDNNVTSLVSEPKQPDFVEDLQTQAINKLLDIKKIDELMANQNQFPGKSYPLDEYVSAIHKAIWKELKTTSPKMDSYRRNLQKAYIGSVQNILLSTNADQTETDAFSLLRADILQLQKEITLALPRVKDKMNRYHLEDMLARIKKTLEANPVIQ
jgi:hypothetical protein